MNRTCLVLAAVLGLAAATPLAAQCTGTVTSTTASPAQLAYATPAVTDFDAGGMVLSTTLTITIKNKTPFTVCAHANTATMGTSTSGTYTKQIADIQVRPTGSTGAWVPLTQADQLIASLTSSSAQTSTVSMDVRIALAWTADEPGSYASSVVFTVYK